MVRLTIELSSKEKSDVSLGVIGLWLPIRPSSIMLRCRFWLLFGVLRDWQCMVVVSTYGYCDIEGRRGGDTRGTCYIVNEAPQKTTTSA